LHEHTDAFLESDGRWDGADAEHAGQRLLFFSVDFAENNAGEFV